VRLSMLASMGAMLVVAIAVPGAFGDDAVLFGVAYLVVRVLHLLLSALVARDEPASQGALLRFAPTAILGASLIVIAAFLDEWRVAVWIVALAIDYLGPVVIGIGRGWAIAPEHFAERFRLIILIALGESIVAIGLGAGPELDSRVLMAVALGVVLVSALWWLYFDVAAIIARARLVQLTGVQRARLARDSYNYLHLPMVAGIILLAFGVETVLHGVTEALDTVTAVGLCGGTALYLLGHVAFLFRATHYVFRLRTIGAGVLLVLTPAALAMPALATLALVSAICSLLVAYEAVRHRADRASVRRPQPGR